MQTTLDQALQYPLDVLAGKHHVGELIRYACQRHVDDMARDDLRFNAEKANRALRFFTLLPHVKGSLTGKPIKLMDWQAWVVVSLHGWEMKRGDIWTRRFRRAYLEVGRKNAKSTLLSGLSLLATGFDGEGGAEVYSAATTRDQARIVWGDAANMIKLSPPLKQLFKPLRLIIEQKDGSSIFKPLSADAQTLDGLNTHFAAIDEYHAHPTSDVMDVIESSTGSRTNPLMFIITTAGFNLQGPCFTMRKQYIEPLLRGQVDDDSYFAAIYTLDKDDDPFDESNWPKANPGLGICKDIETLREESKKAKFMPAARVNFLTKHMNVWVQSAGTFLDMAAWNECPGSLDDDQHKYHAGYIGVDLARQWDWSAVTMVLKCSDGTYDVRAYGYLPEDTMDKVPKQLRQVYEGFIEDGSLILTPGNIIDQTIIRDKILHLSKTFDVREVAFDQYNASWLLAELQGCGVELVGVSQGTRAMSPAMGDLGARIMGGMMRNPQNSALSWHLGNVVLKQIDAKNMLPAKEHVDNKIDLAVALLMATSRALADNRPDLTGFLSSPNIVKG